MPRQDTCIIEYKHLKPGPQEIVKIPLCYCSSLILFNPFFGIHPFIPLSAFSLHSLARVFCPSSIHSVVAFCHPFVCCIFLCALELCLLVGCSVCIALVCFLLFVHLILSCLLPEPLVSLLVLSASAPLRFFCPWCFLSRRPGDECVEAYHEMTGTEASIKCSVCRGSRAPMRARS